METKANFLTDIYGRQETGHLIEGDVSYSNAV